MHKIQGLQTGNNLKHTPSTTYRNRTSEGNLNSGTLDNYSPMILNDTNMQYENVMQDRNN